MSGGKSDEPEGASARPADAIPSGSAPDGIPSALDDVAPTEAAAEALPEDARDEADRALEDMEARLRRVSSAYQQLQGEMTAFRERTERLQAERERLQRVQAVRAVFEPVQNLRRSVETLSRMELPAEVAQGLGILLAQFQHALQDLGLEEISGNGVPFDPNQHEAMATVEVPLAGMDGLVVQVFDVGYRIGGQVVQPARVVVGRYTPPAAPEPECEA